MIDDGGTANGGEDTDQSPNTITFDVDPVNDAPAGTDNTITINEDGSHTFAAGDFGFSDPNDASPDTFQSVMITTLPATGTLELNNVAVTADQIIAVGDLANLVYTPAANENGDGYANFTFQVIDDGGTANGGEDTDQSPNTITFDVDPVNDAPDAVNDFITLGAGNTATNSNGQVTSVTLNPLFNDKDIDANDTLTITAVAGLAIIAGQTVALADGAQITLNLDGTLTYTPVQPIDTSFSSFQTEFEYTIADTGGLKDTATVTLSAVDGLPFTFDVVFTSWGGNVIGDKAGRFVSIANDGLIGMTIKPSDPDTGIFVNNNELTVGQGQGSQIDVGESLTFAFRTSVTASNGQGIEFEGAYLHASEFGIEIFQKQGATPTNLEIILYDDNGAAIDLKAFGTDLDSYLNIVTAGSGTPTVSISSSGAIIIQGAVSGTLIGFEGIDGFSFSAVEVNNAGGGGFTLTVVGVDIIETVFEGTAVSDILEGDELANVLFGLDGNDTINGKEGQDILVGGPGNDTYKFDNNAFTDVDLIEDYINLGTGLEQDSIDLSLLFDDHAIGEVVYDGATGSLYFDKTGGGDGTPLVQIAQVTTDGSQPAQLGSLIIINDGLEVTVNDYNSYVV